MRINSQQDCVSIKSLKRDKQFSFSFNLSAPFWMFVPLKAIHTIYASIYSVIDMFLFWEFWTFVIYGPDMCISLWSTFLSYMWYFVCDEVGACDLFHLGASNCSFYLTFDNILYLCNNLFAHYIVYIIISWYTSVWKKDKKYYREPGNSVVYILNKKKKGILNLVWN